MMCRPRLAGFGIETEVIDVQTLLPFDLEHPITDSIRKTNRVLFADEDVPGGATAYMLQQVVDEQGAWRYLDSTPQPSAPRAPTSLLFRRRLFLQAQYRRSIFESVYEILHEAKPAKFPIFYR